MCECFQRAKRLVYPGDTIRIVILLSEQRITCPGFKACEAQYCKGKTAVFY